MPLLKWLGKSLKPAPWTPLHFKNIGFHVLDKNVLWDEESLDIVAKNAFYPMTIGEILVDRYRGKLG